MLKKNTRFHYGIKKHTCGTSYNEDCWVLDDNYRPLKYVYRQSAEFISNELQKENKHVKYYVARCD